MGYVQLKRAFRRCMGLGGGLEPYFFCKSAIVVDGLGFFAFSGPVLDIPPTPTPINGCAFGVGLVTPPILRVGCSKNMFQTRLGQWESCTRATL